MRNPQEISLLLEENIAQESWSLHLHLLLGALVAPLHTPRPPGCGDPTARTLAATGTAREEHRVNGYERKGLVRVARRSYEQRADSVRPWADPVCSPPDLPHPALSGK
jgi:hypothetical protein